MVKLIIFDWDDVFTLGSTEGYLHCYHKALLRVGANLSAAEEKKRIVEKWGWPFEVVIKNLLLEHPDKVEDATRAYEQALLGGTFINHLTIVPGAIELLRRLKDKYQLAVVSGINPTLFLDRVLTRFNIPYVFNEMISVYNLPSPELVRPNPYMAEQILKRLDKKPKETVMVGDAENDMKFAFAAGLTPIAVLTGHLSREQAKNLGVKYIISDVTKLEEVLEVLNI